MRIGTLDDLAVQFEHQPKNTVGRGMLGPEIDGEVANGGFDHCCSPRLSGQGVMRMVRRLKSSSE
ncbi:hypothetical protein [Mesorhizobium sp.]|uniref:hypothetical protein n=1 Tax=Mesorhizobium sp. TaxID=1871066 RepID=UPI0025ED1776|nr:hypothetical protein [Mesorhizobium sp.]